MNKLKSLSYVLIPSILVLLASLLINTDTLAQQYPPGNYKESCTDLLKVGHMLEAKCRKEDVNM